MSASLPSLAELFPDGNYEFNLTLRRTTPQEFFGRWDESGGLLAERARWIAENPARYVALLPEGEPLLTEFAALAGEWGQGAHEPGLRSRADGKANRAFTVADVGRRFEPDVLFLSADESGAFRLRGGALCFPTSWALEDKLGHTLEFIHGVVPGLNAALGAPIQQFLSKLKPGTAYLRHNWGLAATDALNLHPARRLSSPKRPVDLRRLWLRVEHQALVALPQARGIVFGIRIALHRLDEVAAGPARAGLRRALETMPLQMAAYKGLGEVREDVIKLL